MNLPITALLFFVSPSIPTLAQRRLLRLPSPLHSPTAALRPETLSDGTRTTEFNATCAQSEDDCRISPRTSGPV